MKVLMLGCGRSKKRNIYFNDGPKDFSNDELTTIDMDPGSEPTFIQDLNEDGILHFQNEAFDEIHAYDVLEHLGNQGDWKGFFDEFEEYHRVLKTGGRMFISVPINGDALGDPGHRRFFHQNHFMFLSQKFYEQEKERATMATDYRWYWKKNFEVEMLTKQENHHLIVILRKA